MTRKLLLTATIELSRSPPRSALGLPRPTVFTAADSVGVSMAGSVAAFTAGSVLADSYALSGDWEYGILSPEDALPKAKAAATKALALDDRLAEAHTSLAFILDLYEWDWETAEKEYKRAIALYPGYATAHHWYAWHLIVAGRSSEAIGQLKTAGYRTSRTRSGLPEKTEVSRSNRGI